MKDYTWLKKLPPKSPDYLGSHKYIYAYIFEEYKSVYVGLTNSIRKRHNQHTTKEDSSVYRFARNHECDVPAPKIMEEGVPYAESGDREKYWIDYFQENGWIIINRAKTGARESSLGASFPLKWNKRTLREKAAECGYHLPEFMKKYVNAYYALKDRYPALYAELFPNRIRKHHYSLDDAQLYMEGRIFKNRSALRREAAWVHRILNEHNLLDKYFPKKHYTREEALKESKVYRSIEQIRVKNRPLYTYLKNENLFKEAKPLDAKFTRTKDPNLAWDVSLHFRTSTEMRTHASVAWKTLKDNNLLDNRFPRKKKR